MADAPDNGSDAPPAPTESGSALLGGGGGAPVPSDTPPPEGGIPTPEGSEKPWYAAIEDPELRGLAEARHWDNPEKALRSYRELEKLRGVPADKLARIPDDINNAEAMAEVYAKLGRPEKPEGYQSVPGDDNAWLREAMHEAGLNDTQAKRLFDGYADWNTKAVEESQKEFSQQAQVDMENLRREWGAAYDTNIEAAQRFARESGLDANQMLDIETSLGTKGMLEMFAKWGKTAGEGSPPEGGRQSAESGDRFGKLTPEAAAAERKALLADPEFQKRIMSEDKRVREQALAQRSRLSQLAFDR